MSSLDLGDRSLTNFWFGSDEVIYCMNHDFEGQLFKKNILYNIKKYYYCGYEIAFIKGKVFLQEDETCV